MSDNEGIGTKRTYSKVDAPDKDADERRNRFSEEMAKPYDDFALVDTQWLNQFYDGDDAPVLLGKGEAASKVGNSAFELLREWYGIRSDAVSVRVVNLERKRPAEVLVLETAKTLSDALGVPSTYMLYGARVPSAFADKNTFGPHARPFDSGMAVEKLTLERDETLVIENPEGYPLGQTGLDNMWNTCFMNSSLQCLLHIPELLTYFLNDEFKQDLNRKNPIGCGGEVADAFAGLVQEAYSERTSSLRPVEFRSTIGRFNRSFAGRMQQDSQEFTAFLLDSLHEDLNRVHEKPATTEPELGDNEIPDEPVIKRLAHESWETHKKRNDSKIMDLFTGMYKSTLICPVCEKVSVRFDPFFDLTLPLPSSTYWVHSVVYVPWNPEQSPVKVEVALTPADSVLALKAQVANIMGSSAERLIAGDVFQRKFYRLLKDNGTVADTIDTSDVIVLYEQARADATGKSHDESELADVATSVPVYVLSQAYQGLPFFVSVTESMSADEIKFQVNRKLEQLVGECPSYHIKVFDGVFDELAYSIPESRTWRLDEPNAPLKDNGQTVIGPQTPPHEAEEPFETVTVPLPQDEGSQQLNSPAQSPGSSSISPLSDTESPPVVTSERDAMSEDVMQVERHIDPRNCVLLVETESDTSLEDASPAFRIVENPAAVTAKSIREEHRVTTLEDCLDRFAQPEILGENDLWYCPRCKEFRQAQKQIELWRVPDVLMIHLKRFSGSMSSSKKIEDLVSFPLKDLDLRKHLCEGAQRDNKGLVYDLIAVDNHYGGMGGGHYTAYVWDAFTEKWLHFNDSFVSEVDESSVVSPAAYLLFYKRRSTSQTALDSVREAIQGLRSRRRAAARVAGSSADATTSASVGTSSGAEGSTQSRGVSTVPSQSLAQTSPSSQASNSDPFRGEGHRLGKLSEEDAGASQLPWSS